MSYSQSGYVMEHNDYDIMIMIIGGGNFYVNNLCLFLKLSIWVVGWKLFVSR